MRSARHVILFVSLAVLAALAACRGRSHDPRLLAAADSIAANPLAAVTFIDSINPASLSADDRHYRDLLSIKARDKAYATHTSDSLITSVLAWASDYGDDDILTEALYYGGRVYSDLGDYPSALRFFQDALDRLPPDRCDINLRGSVLAQTAYVCLVLHLYDQAIPYLTESIDIDKQLSDTFALAYDNEYLARAYIGKKDYDTATKHYETALKLASQLDIADEAYILIELANAYYLSGRNEIALALINGIPEKLQSDKRLDLAMIKQQIYSYYVVANEIYYKTGIYDSVHKYSQILIQSENTNKQISGYKMLLKPELIDRFSADSIRALFLGYASTMNADYDKRSDEANSVQNSRFNYSRFERENDILIQSNNLLHQWVYALTTAIIIFICTLVIIKFVDNKKEAILRKSLSETQTQNSKLSKKIAILTGDQPHSINNLEDENRVDLTRVINDIKKWTPNKKIVGIETGSYKTIADLVRARKALPDKSDKWEDILNDVEAKNPNFFPTLQKLSDGSLTAQEYKLAALIRIGFSTSEIAIVLSKTKGAITYYRKGLLMKLFGSSLKIESLDSALRSL